MGPGLVKKVQVNMMRMARRFARQKYPGDAIVSGEACCRAWWGVLGDEHACIYPSSSHAAIASRPAPRRLYRLRDSTDPGSSLSKNSHLFLLPEYSLSDSRARTSFGVWRAHVVATTYPASPHNCPSFKPSSCPTHRASHCQHHCSSRLPSAFPSEPIRPTTWSTAPTAPRRSRPPTPQVPKPRSTSWARAQAQRSSQPYPPARA